MSEDIQSIVKAYSERIHDRDVFFAPHIPSRKSRNALRSYARGAAEEKLLALIDATLFGGARLGLVLTDKMIYAKNMLQSPTKVALHAVKSVGLREGGPGRLWVDGRYVDARPSDLYINGHHFFKFAELKKVETMRLFTGMLQEISRVSRLAAPAVPTGPLTAEEEALVEGSNLSGCMACPSTRRRPLIVLSKDGVPPGKPDHCFVYSHDAIFGCDDCHNGFAEKRRHDCGDFEDVYDQDEHYALDAVSVMNLLQCLPECPNPASAGCTCKVHQSLRASWTSLPSQLWAQYIPDFPRALLQMADPDQEKWVIPRVSVELVDDMPRLMPQSGQWSTDYENGNPKAEGAFINGLMNGKWTFWYQNRQKKAEGEYVLDQREGKWTEWNDRGEITSEETFRGGQRVSPPRGRGPG